jgi:hypothetical protein
MEGTSGRRLTFFKKTRLLSVFRIIGENTVYLFLQLEQNVHGFRLSNSFYL